MTDLRQAFWLKSGHYATSISGDVYYRWDENDTSPIELHKTKYTWDEKVIPQNAYYKVPIGSSEKAVHIIIARNYPEICGEWCDGCVVHHKNGLKYDNIAENLQIMSKEEHTKWHAQTPINYKGVDYDGFNACTKITGDPYWEIISNDSLIIKDKEEM